MRWKKGERVGWVDRYGNEARGTVERYVRIRGRSMVRIRCDNGAVAHVTEGHLEAQSPNPESAVS